ncbi:hypothetical protein HMPREF3176_01705 [Dermabacter sp. HMSC08H10]|nr:hypothetical protein HMPREF3176_01705 [Dermabacter sp. HMSC08H10]
MLGDIHQPFLIQTISRKIALHQFVTYRRTSFLVAALSCRNGRLNAGDLAQPPHPSLRDDKAEIMQIISEHPAPALGVVLVEFTQYLNDLRVSNLSGRQRLFQPLVMRLLRKRQHPARHRHRHSNAGTGRGHLLDEWEHCFVGVI